MFDDSTRHPLLDDFYNEFLSSEKSADFILRVSQHYTLDTLQRIAVVGSRISRRAAVLAVGFLGDFRSNPVLGDALSDSDRFPFDRDEAPLLQERRGTHPIGRLGR